jgi:hypothetical protein
MALTGSRRFPIGAHHVVSVEAADTGACAATSIPMKTDRVDLAARKWPRPEAL